MSKKRRYNRPAGTRSYRKMFVLSTEGKHTEPEYFQMLKNEKAVIHIKCLNRRSSDPKSVLKEMRQYLKKESLRNNDEAWLVIDKDQWTDEQLNVLYKWSETDLRYGLAVSNPQFEYWLLLHFENGNKITSSKNCLEKLKKYLPDYNKHLQYVSLRDKVEDAIIRARTKDNPPCSTWPANNGTTVYRLVERIIGYGKK